MAEHSFTGQSEETARTLLQAWLGENPGVKVLNERVLAARGIGSREGINGPVSIIVTYELPSE